MLSNKDGGKLKTISGWRFGTFFIFHIWDVILPIDELIFFRGVGQPPTRLVFFLRNDGAILGCLLDQFMAFPGCRGFRFRHTFP